MESMIPTESIIRIIFGAIDEINAQRPKGGAVEKSIEGSLYGRTGKLDSLGLVNLIVVTERRIEEEFGVAVTLADEKAVSQETSPFRTAKTFAEYIARRLAERDQ
jgi:acyl carrier protein